MTSHKMMNRPMLVCSVVLLASLLTGCGGKSTATAALQEAKIAISIDSLSAYSAEGNQNTVKQLIMAGVGVNGRDSAGNTPLTLASWAGKQELVTLLLDEKADVNMATSKSLAPLMAAVSQKQEPVALILLSRGADANTQNAEGSTPLMEASWQGRQALVKELITKGANINYVRTRDEFSALKAAIANNQLETITLLRSLGATN